MFTSLKVLKEGFSEVLFPTVCVICGLRLSKTELNICSECVRSKFELANFEGKQISSDTLLPEGVILQHALWNFDKGGFLQDILHDLKYKRLTGIGDDLGVALGRNVLKNSYFKFDKKAMLVPVPLHPKKRKLRGFNQARHIAEGISRVTKIPICDQSDAIRIKNTQTQTGFTLEMRKQNINEAFQIEEKSSIRGKICVIVDDVFTTGATAFELAKVLLNAGAYKIMIITVAQA